MRITSIGVATSEAAHTNSMRTWMMSKVEEHPLNARTRRQVRGTHHRFAFFFTAFAFPYVAGMP